MMGNGDGSTSLHASSLKTSSMATGKVSIQSASPSIKSLPREIKLQELEESCSSILDESLSKRTAATTIDDESTRTSCGLSGGSFSGTSSLRSRSDRSALGRYGRVKSGGGKVVFDITNALEDVFTDTQFVTEHPTVDPYGERGVYTGAISKASGMPNGKGRLEYEKQGRWYEGDWIQGRWTGHGRLSNGEGDFYQGGMKNDHKHGHGIMNFADGRIFDGEYHRGRMMHGTMQYPDGTVYCGSFVNDMRHGKGVCNFKDGSVYDGDLYKGKFHGRGKMTWSDGGYYIGDWLDGEMHGNGKEVRPDGSIRHEGEWKRRKPVRTASDKERRRRRKALQQKKQQMHQQQHQVVLHEDQSFSESLDEEVIMEALALKDALQSEPTQPQFKHVESKPVWQHRHQQQRKHQTRFRIEKFRADQPEPCREDYTSRPYEHDFIQVHPHNLHQRRRSSNGNNSKNSRQSRGSSR